MRLHLLPLSSSTDGALAYTDKSNSIIAFNDYYFKSGNTQSLTAAQAY